MPELHITTPDGQEFVFNLGAESYSIGRAEGNDLVVPDASISGSHARFIQDGDTYILEDSGSTNGTRVNGEPMTQAVRLTFGDSVDFGNVRGSFAPELAATPVAPPEPARSKFHSQPLNKEPVVAIQTPASEAFGPATKKKDSLGSMAMALAFVALLACLALIGVSLTMNAG